MTHHTHDPVCPACQEKLGYVLPDLASWFREVKFKYPDVHISWGFRDQQEQEEAFSTGKTHLHFPMSAHNKTPALALDLFQIDDSGKAVFSKEFMTKLAQEAMQTKAPVAWGGHYASLGDMDHFQFNPFVET